MSDGRRQFNDPTTGTPFFVTWDELVEDLHETRAEVERLRADNDELHLIAEQATRRAEEVLAENDRLRADLATSQRVLGLRAASEDEA